ncbi:MAG: 4-alpha-glucanotransferase [Asticcacaulis sp.]
MGRSRAGFDAHAPLLTAIGQDPALRGLKLIAEPWDCGPGGYRLGGFPAPWSEWNDRYRDTARRFWRGDGVSLGDLARSLSGSQDVFGGRPAWSSVNFVTAHDGFTLKDLVSFDRKHNGANGEQNRDGTDQNYSWLSGDPARDQRNLLATLLISRGTPMLSMGAETGQSQDGNNNAYCQDNATSWLDWTAQDKSLTAFCARLISARREHPALRGGFLSGEVGDGDWPDVAWTRADGQPLDAGMWDDPHGETLVATFCAGDDRVCVIINRGEAVEVRLPDGPWRVLIDTADDGRGETVRNKVTVQSRSVVILVSETQRETGVDDDMLARLSSAAGIEPKWWTIDGVRHKVPRDTKLHILKSLGLPAESQGEARDSLLQLAERHDPPLPALRSCPPWRRAGGCRPPCALPSGGPPLRTRLEIVREDGDKGRIEVADLTPRRVTARDGRPYLIHDLNLGTLPIGRYVLKHGDDACILTVASERAWQPEWTGPAFGVTAQLYAARRSDDGGIGDFTALGELMERAGRTGAALVGVNPLHALFPDNRDRASPYYPSDRRFLDPIYLDTGEGYDDGPVIDYPAVWARKERALRASFETEKSDADFAAFIAEAGETLQAFTAGSDGLFQQYLQWQCDRQLAAAVARGQTAGAGLYRDLAIGAAPDGAEGKTLAALIAKGVSLGAPPDPFSRDGQVWGIPPFSPLALPRDGYAAIGEIYRANMRHAKALRIDHAIGLMRQFWVPDGAAGKDGAYVRFPYSDLLGVLKLESARAQCLIVGEDLGTVPEGFRERMHEAGILSYKVMPFEREGLSFRPPQAYPSDSLACASTHDLPPLKGWWSGAEIAERRALGLDVADNAEAVRREEKIELLAALKAAGVLEDGDPDGPLTVEIAAAIHAFIAATPAVLAMVQLEDLAGAAVPINLPGTDRETAELAASLA